MDPNDTDAQVKKDPTDKEAAEYAEVDQNEMSGDSSKALDDEWARFEKFILYSATKSTYDEWLL